MVLGVHYTRARMRVPCFFTNKYHFYTTQFPRTIDFNAPCDVSAVLTSLHDPSVPLTTSLLSKLRGCAILLFFRTPRSGTTVFYYLLEKLGQSLGYKASLMRPIKRGDIQEFWVSCCCWLGCYLVVVVVVADVVMDVAFRILFL